MSIKTLLSVAVLFLGLTSIALAASREIVHRTHPVYPEIAKRTNLQGVVTLKVTIGADGKVKSVSTVLPPPSHMDV